MKPPPNQIALAALREELAHLLGLSLQLEQALGSLCLSGPDQARAMMALQSGDRLTQGLRDLLRIADHLALKGDALTPESLGQLAASLSLGQIRSSLTGTGPRDSGAPGLAELF